MSASPTSPSSRKRQQAGASSQPPPIAPAPGSLAGAAQKEPAAASPTPLATTRTLSTKLPTPINVETANKTADATAKSPPSPASSRKRKASEMTSGIIPASVTTEVATPEQTPFVSGKSSLDSSAPVSAAQPSQVQLQPPPAKKSRTNTPWTPAEERKLKTLRDAGSSWGEIAKEFLHRTEGSVKKHWYKDMHYADFAEDESAALLAAIREYEANKWKEIGKRVGKPAKACEQYAKEHFSGRL